MVEKITIQAIINAPVDKVWDFYTEPKHIIQWNSPSPDWHTPSAKNDLKVGGKFFFRMEAKDGSAGFDFEGIYDQVKKYEIISYTIADGRKVKVTFTQNAEKTKVIVMFEPEKINSIEMQRSGWQAILDNIKAYIENN